MDNSPAKREQTQSLDTPGVGVAGKVLCPFTKGICQKSACELWVELTYGKQKVGRCSYAWKAILEVETRQEIERLRKDLKEK
jgi:hypothetical protein